MTPHMPPDVFFFFFFFFSGKPAQTEAGAKVFLLGAAHTCGQVQPPSNGEGRGANKNTVLITNDNICSQQTAGAC